MLERTVFDAAFLHDQASVRPSSAGRRPVLLELRPEYAYAMGLTISRMGIEVGLVDLAGHLRVHLPVRLSRSSRAKTMLEIKRALRDLLASGDVGKGRMLGLGISAAKLGENLKGCGSHRRRFVPR